MHAKGEYNMSLPLGEVGVFHSGLSHHGNDWLGLQTATIFYKRIVPTPKCFHSCELSSYSEQEEVN
jgi:hypothetical protein